MAGIRIGVTGASGFVGQYVVRALARLGHPAVAFSRTPNRSVKGCIETRGFDTKAEISVAGLGGIIHLAGESVFGIWTEAKRRRIMESRRDGTRALVSAILNARQNGQNVPNVLVSASAIGIYGDAGETVVDEAAPVGTGFLADVAKTWEAEALRAETGGVRVAVLRIGLVLGTDGGAMQRMRPLFRAGLGARFGNGRQWVSWIDVRDLAKLFVFAIENPKVRGVLNATSPEPIRNDGFTAAMAQKFHRKARLVVPASVLRLALGGASHVLLDSQRVLPKRALELGYRWQAPEL